MLEDPEKLVAAVGRRIAELRVRLGKTQEEVAEEAGVTVNYWAKLEHGEENLTLKSLAKLGSALGVRAVDLLRAPSKAKPSMGRPRRRK